MQFVRYLSILIILLLCAPLLQGQNQNIKFKHLTADDGLSQNWVRCVSQDSYGFIWFGTGDNGINKYDGYECKVYKNDPKDKSSLTNNGINTLYIDKKHRLWVSTQRGLNIYNREKDRFDCFPALQSIYINGLYESDDGKLYAICGLNIFEINFEKKSAVPLCPINNSCFSDIFNGTIVKDLKGNLWIGSLNGLYVINLSNKSFVVYKHNDNDPKSISDNVLETIHRDSKGRIWIGTVNKGLSLLNYENGKSVQPYFINLTHDPNNINSINEGRIRAILDDGSGQLWIGLENGGLDLLDLNNVEKGKYIFKHLKNNMFDETSLSNNSIYSIFKDYQGTIWIGTFSRGVNYYNKLLYKFEYYKPIPNTESDLINNTVNVFFEEGDNLWIGTEGGLNILNRKTGLYKILSCDPNNPEEHWFKCSMVYF